jgi:hypothetical protein
MSTKYGLKAQASGDPADLRRFKAWYCHDRERPYGRPATAVVVCVVVEAS